MKHIAVVLAALLSLTLVAPAMAQPFADVPTDHWAYDAIAELAAKGLIEGYPDGAFRGDRAMTRYEMAMVVARVLARIEAIKIPPMPPDLVRRPELTKTDAATRAALTATITATDKRLTASITTLNRLVAEFRAELAALGVRVTAVEEELAALRARMDNTKIAGDTFLRYQFSQSRGVNASFARARLTFTGRPSPTTSATVRLIAGGEASGLYPLGTPGYGLFTGLGNVTFDNAYVDTKFLNFDWRWGRQNYTQGAFGLLFNDCGVTAPRCAVDGYSVKGKLGGMFDVSAASFWHLTVDSTGAGHWNNAVWLGMARVSTGAFIPGWTLGVNYYSERHTGFSPTPNLVHQGWSFDLSGTLVPGVRITGEYASFTPSGGTAQTAYQVSSVLDLRRLLGVAGWSPTLTVGYKSYPAVWSPILPGSMDILGITNYQDYRVWNARLDLTYSPWFRPYFIYESGTNAAGTATRLMYEAGWFSTIATNTTFRFRYQVRENAGVATAGMPRYRVELSYSW